MDIDLRREFPYYGLLKIISIKEEEGVNKERLETMNWYHEFFLSHGLLIKEPKNLQLLIFNIVQDLGFGRRLDAI